MTALTILFLGMAAWAIIGMFQSIFLIGNDNYYVEPEHAMIQGLLIFPIMLYKKLRARKQKKDRKKEIALSNLFRNVEEFKSFEIKNHNYKNENHEI